VKVHAGIVVTKSVKPEKDGNPSTGVRKIIAVFGFCWEKARHGVAGPASGIWFTDPGADEGHGVPSLMTQFPLQRCAFGAQGPISNAGDGSAFTQASMSATGTPRMAARLAA
jgi:hypothetical protein